MTLLPNHKRGEPAVPARKPQRIPAMAQVGWLGQTGNVYALDFEPSEANEPGGYAPLYFQVGTWHKRPVKEFSLGWELRE